MRLVVATQVVDADDTHLAVTVDLLGALARRVDEVVAVTDHVGRHALPANVRFRTFGASTRLARGLRFERAVAGELVRGRAVFLAHMVPQYAVLASPAAKARRAPLALWYTHWQTSRALRWAARVSDVVLSVDRASFPLPSEKVRGIGHAIDLDRFAPLARDGAQDRPFRLLSLGRTERRKGLPLLLDAVERASAAGLQLELEIRGPQVNEAERSHRDELVARIAASPVLRERVRVEGPVPRERVPAVIAAADAVVSPTRGETTAGALDKVVYEAAACAVPVLASNPNFGDVLGGLDPRLLFRAGDVDDFLAAVAELAAAPAERRAALGAELRRRVEARHSLESWADAVVAALGAAQPGGR